MDKETIINRLENKLGFDRIKEMISNRCSTDYAVELVENESFSNDPSEIYKRLVLTDEMRLILMFEENFPTSGYIDCLNFLDNLEKPGSSIDKLSLGKLKTMLDTVRKLTGFFSGMKDGVYPNLKKMAAPIKSYPLIIRKIDLILDKYGEIRDNASEELLNIRKSIKDKQGNISKRANLILKKAQQDGIVESDASLSVRDGKLLIPVSASNKRRIPGFVYDESSTGKTLFIEPTEIIELENEISELHFAESREIARILYDFTEALRPYIPDMKESAGYIGEIDFIMAKAQIALDFKAGMPIISENGEMNLRKARHPLLEKALDKEKKPIVPLTININPTKHILLISGPNAGGKSVCLKTTGLLQYMFQWGMLIPTSETSEMPIFDRILLSIGDDQSIDNDLSTYSSFLADMKEMLKLSDSKTLVLIDEFGSGTEPAAGGAIAEAILNELDKRGVYGVITTHYTNLKLYAASGDCGVINGAMQFDAKNMTPLFKLEIGLPGNSFAFEMARKMGLPENIVKAAEEKAGEEYVGIERNLRQIARNRRVLEGKLHKIKITDKTLENITGKYQKELEGIQKAKKDILEKATKEAEEIVKGANKQVENTIRTIKESQADKAKTQEARKELQGFISALQEQKEQQQKNQEDYIEKKLNRLKARQEKEKARKGKRGEKINDTETLSEEKGVLRNGPLKVGEKVRVKDNGLVGEITSISTKNVSVIIGNMTTKMPIDKVERISSNEYKNATKNIVRTSAPRVSANITARKLNFKPEIDVRGERLNDAIDIVNHFIDDAIMLNIPSVRIIHGKGTGVLRDELQKILKTIPGVSSVKDEQIQFGGTGVTIVTFE